MALELLTPDEIERINALGERLASGLRQLFAPRDLDCATSCGVTLGSGEHVDLVMDANRTAL